MKNNLYGVFIKVENLGVCKAFYRDILDLGAPVIDSNFWVEFKLQDNVSLVLEKAEEGEKIPVSRGNISWLYHVDSIDHILGRLKQYGFEPLAEEKARMGVVIYQFCDPEGNPFYLTTGEIIEEARSAD